MKRYIRSTSTHCDDKYTVHNTGNGYVVYLHGKRVSNEFVTEKEAHDWINEQLDK